MFLQKLPEIHKWTFTDLSRSRQWCLPNSYSSVPMSTHTGTRPQWFRLRLYSTCTARQLLPSPLEEHVPQWPVKPWHGVLGRELLLTLAPSTRNSYWRFSRTKGWCFFTQCLIILWDCCKVYMSSKLTKIMKEKEVKNHRIQRLHLLGEGLQVTSC